MSSNLSIPNAIANGTTADGNEVDANFDAIQSWADTYAVETSDDRLTPAGVIEMYGGAAAPTGYLLCDGTAVSRATYADLFTAIGTAFGTGDGSTTFNVPNLKGRFPVGLNSADTAHDALGETGGSQDAIVVTHTHTTPAHSHSVDPPSTAVTNGTDVITYGAGLSSTVDSTGGGLAINTENLSVDIAAFSTATDGSGTSGSTGSSGTDANLPPYLTLNFIIKT